MSSVSTKNLKPKCKQVSSLLRALSHPQRLMILGHLTEDAKTVSELKQLCEISQSQISQFLGRMRAEGLVDYSRDGKFLTYRVKDKKVSELIGAIQSIYCK